MEDDTENLLDISFVNSGSLTYDVVYTFNLVDNIEEVSGKLKYNSKIDEYEFEPDVYSSYEAESYFDENWEDIQEEILFEFYKKI